VIDLVNELSKKFDVFLIPNRMSEPIGLSDNVVCCRSADVHAIKPNIVFSTYSTLLATNYLKAKLKVPVVNYMFIYMTMRDVLSTKFLALPNSYKLREILKLIILPFPKSLLMFDKLIVPNFIIWKELSRLGFPTGKVIILPWGINIDRYKSTQEYPLPSSFLNSVINDNNENIIVYAGPLHPLRFSPGLLYTFRNVKKDADAHLLLLFRRDLWHQPTYRKLISVVRNLSLEKNVTIITSSSYEAYLSCIARASVVILPYFTSGIVEVPPFTLLECMALSKPVITSHGVATYGIIENGVNGFIIPESYFSLSNKLSNLISFFIFNKRKTRQVGQNAIKYVLENYNLNSFSRKLSSVLESFCR